VGISTFPLIYHYWTNIKVLFKESWTPLSEMSKKKQRKGMGMVRMLELLWIELEGRHHSGLDDSRNIAKILIQLMKEWDCIPRITGPRPNQRGTRK